MKDVDPDEGVCEDEAGFEQVEAASLERLAGLIQGKIDLVVFGGDEFSGGVALPCQNAYLGALTEDPLLSLTGRCGLVGPVHG
ncbi:hypothetical protein ES705_05513 [subsurface metagenome]